MARIRTIKPEFFTSLTVAGLPLTARLTFIGVWTYADDFGRGVDDPRLVRAAVWPLDERTVAEVEADMTAIAEAGLIRRYEVDGRRYLTVTGWAEHQKVSHPTPSKIPAPVKNGRPTEPPKVHRDEEPAQPDEPPVEQPEPAAEEAQPPDSGISPEPSGVALESLQSPPETFAPDQGSGIRERKGNHHPRARDDTLRLVRELTGADDDESSHLIQKILTEHHPRNPGGYIRTMHRKGHLVPVLDQVRAERRAAALSDARRAQQAAAQVAEPERPQATPEDGQAARERLRALAAAGKRKHRGGEPARLGEILDQPTARTA